MPLCCSIGKGGKGREKVCFSPPRWRQMRDCVLIFRCCASREVGKIKVKVAVALSGRSIRSLHLFPEKGARFAAGGSSGKSAATGMFWPWWAIVVWDSRIFRRADGFQRQAVRQAPPMASISGWVDVQPSLVFRLAEYCFGLESYFKSSMSSTCGTGYS